MSAGFTFGSVGDIISLCINIKDLVKALDDSRGSSAEYQEVIRELWALDRVLLEVELLWRTCESTVELNALRETTHRVADQCRYSIEACLKKVKKFGPSLRDGGSGSAFRDASMKIRWQFSRSDDLAKFRAKINAHCSTINMLLLTASVKLNKLNDKRLHIRLGDSEGKAEISFKDQKFLLEELKDQLNENNEQIKAGNAVTLKISETLRLNWIRQLGQDLKNFMQRVFVVNVATYNAVKEIEGRLPSQLERSMYQEPFILEDSIGRIAPVHMQFITSWEAFDSVLELRFRDIQGHRMVRNKEYVIQESATKREIDQTRPWEASFLPGQIIFMSMLFNAATSKSSCPRCQTSSNEPQDSDVQCAECGMWYRRIIEYNDVDPSTSVQKAIARKLREERAVFGRSAFGSVFRGPALPAQLSEKRKRESFQDADIKSFKRVRVLSKMTRFRKIEHLPRPFAGLATARNQLAEHASRAAYNASKDGSALSGQLSQKTLKEKFEHHIARAASSQSPRAILAPRTNHDSGLDDSDDDSDSQNDEILTSTQEV